MISISSLNLLKRAAAEAPPATPPMIITHFITITVTSLYKIILSDYLNKQIDFDLKLIIINYKTSLTK